jgi:hypothetical protein
LLFIRFEYFAEFENFHVKLKRRIASAAYWRKRTENTQANRAYVSDVNQFSMTEACCPIIHLIFWRQYEYLPHVFIGQIQPKQIVKKAIDLRDFKINTIGEITSLLQERRVLQQHARVDWYILKFQRLLLSIRVQLKSSDKIQRVSEYDVSVQENK